MRMNHNRPPGGKHRIRGADPPMGIKLINQESHQFQKQGGFAK